MPSYNHVEVEAMQDQVQRVIHYGGFTNSFKTDKLNDIANLLDDLLIQGCVDCEPEDDCPCSGCNYDASYDDILDTNA